MQHLRDLKQETSLFVGNLVLKFRAQFSMKKVVLPPELD